MAKKLPIPADCSDDLIFPNSFRAQQLDFSGTHETLTICLFGTKSTFPVPTKAVTVIDLIHLLQASAFQQGNRIYELRAFCSGHSLHGSDSLQRSQIIDFQTGGEWPAEKVITRLRFPSGAIREHLFPSVCSLGFVRAFLALSHNLPYDQLTVTDPSGHTRIRDCGLVSVSCPDITITFTPFWPSQSIPIMSRISDLKRVFLPSPLRHSFDVGFCISDQLFPDDRFLSELDFQSGLSGKVVKVRRLYFKDNDGKNFSYDAVFPECNTFADISAKCPAVKDLFFFDAGGHIIPFSRPIESIYNDPDRRISVHPGTIRVNIESSWKEIPVRPRTTVNDIRKMFKIPETGGVKCKHFITYNGKLRKATQRIIDVNPGLEPINLRTSPIFAKGSVPYTFFGNGKTYRLRLKSKINVADAMTRLSQEIPGILSISSFEDGVLPETAILDLEHEYLLNLEPLRTFRFDGSVFTVNLSVDTRFGEIKKLLRQRFPVLEGFIIMIDGIDIMDDLMTIGDYGDQSEFTVTTTSGK
jgi:hypothetical protein